MQPGDLYWYNDCYGSRGAVTHSNDQVLLAPVFDAGRRCAFVMSWAHFADIGGVVHTHAPYCVAWAQAKKPIPIFGTTHADHLTQDVPCTPVMSDKDIKGDYEEETGNVICRTFKTLSYKEIEMVLVACHGPFTWGETPEKAVYNAVVVEELAKMALWTLMIDPKTKRLKNSLINKHFQRKHGLNAYYGQK